jgi:hypothetical protein
MASLLLENIVVVTRQFNPSIIDRHWLIQNRLLSEEDFGTDCIYTPAVARVESSKFVLTAMPERLDFQPLGENVEDKEWAVSLLCKLIETLPHTPYAQTGMNFHWRVELDGEGFAKRNRQLFCNEHSALASHFDAPDARFGAYLSKEELGGRLKLDVKPVTVRTDAGDADEFINLVFNFHFELTGNDRAKEVIDTLGKWKAAREIAEQIAHSVED